MPESYAQTCEALAAFDVTDRLSEIGTPVLAVAGSDDPDSPESLQRIAPVSRTAGSWCSTGSGIWRLPKPREGGRTDR